MLAERDYKTPLNQIQDLDEERIKRIKESLDQFLKSIAHICESFSTKTLETA